MKSNSDSSMSLRRIYFCIDGHGFRHEAHGWLIASLRSVRKNTDLTPFVLYSGHCDEHVRLLEEAGATVLSIRSRLLPAIESKAKSAGLPARTEGVLLRYEVPFIDDAEYSLYVDCDTCFLQGLQLPTEKIPLVGAVLTPNGSNEGEYFNCGVQLFNNAAFREASVAFFEFLIDTLGNWLPSSVDEVAFNKFFRGRVTAIPSDLNWRPMFGYEPNAQIVHFHGIKLADTLNMLTGDYRSYPPSFFANRYGHEMALYAAKGLLPATAYLKNIEAEGLFAGTVLEPLVKQINTHADMGAMVTQLMLARSEMAYVRHWGFSMVKGGTFVGKQINLSYEGQHPEATGLKLVINSELAMGRITVTGNDLDYGRLMLLANQGVRMEVSRSKEGVTAEWCSAGIDSHFVLLFEEGDIGKFALTISIDTPQLFAYELQAIVNGCLVTLPACSSK